MFCHSILGSRMECFDLNIDWAKKNGLRLIIPDRPGYGYSDPNPYISYQLWSLDALELMEKLHINTFSLIGYAAGCHYACTLASLAPDRVQHMVLIGSGSPITEPKDYQKATPLFMMQTQLAKHFPQLYRLFLVILERSLKENPIYYIDLLATEVHADDRLLLQQSKYYRLLELTCAEVSRQGIRAFAEELAQYSQPSTFNYTSIQTPVTLWHGENSSYIPLKNALRVHNQLPHSEFNLVKNANHLFIYQHWPAILAALKQKLTN
uniref:alpha/beta fold hydrolase n=1 Tax=Celerinatantimonas yamalensis TaxID=559956 RepID=UPI0038CBF7E8